VELVETEAEASVDRHPQEQADGSFSLILPAGDELNISEAVKKSPPPEVKQSSGVKQEAFLSKSLMGQRQAEQG
jgi:hypothetical protein